MFICAADSHTPYYGFHIKDEDEAKETVSCYLRDFIGFQIEAVLKQ